MSEAQKSPRSLRATTVALHRVLWKRGLQGNSAQIMMIVLLAIYGFLGVFNLGAMVGFALYSGGDSFHALTGANVIGVVVYLLLAVFLPAGERQLDSDSFVGLPVRMQEARPGLMAIAFINSRVIISAVCSIVWAVLGSIFIVNFGAAIPAVSIVAFVVGMVLSWFVTIVLSECVVNVARTFTFLDSDKGKAFAGIFGVVLILAMLSLNGRFDGAIPLGAIGDVAAWTPLSAATGWATALANGSYIEAGIQLLIAAATVVALVAWWRYLIARDFAKPGLLRASKAPIKDHGVSRLRLHGVAYRSPAAMEYSRSLLYMGRDSRLLGTLLMLPLVGVFAIYKVVTGDFTLGMGGLVFLGLLSGLVAVNDFGYDGPSGWCKMVTPTPPHKYFAARHFAHITPAALFVLCVTVVATIFGGRPLLSVCFGCASLGMLLSSGACSAVLSAVNPYPTSAPGTNPLADKSGYSAGAFVGAFLGFFLGWVASAPGLVLMVIGYNNDSVALLCSGAALALVIPVIAEFLCLHFVGKHVDSKMPEIYAKVDAWVK